MDRTFHMLLYRAFHAQRSYLRPALNALGLGPGQPKLLGRLERQGASRQKQLADYFEIDPAAVSRMLEALERSGFVRRRPETAGGRRDLVEITEAGSRAYAAWRLSCQEMEARMLRDFTQEERDRFADYLTRARQNLRADQEGRVWES